MEEKLQTKKEAIISRELNRLGQAAKFLTEKTDMLEGVLTPILREAGPVETRDKEEEEQLVPLAAKIKENREKIDRIIEKVKDITERIEL